MSRLLVAVVGLVAVGTACQGTSDQTRFRESLPAFEDIEMVSVGTYPLVEDPALPLTPEDNGGRIEWMLEQLRRAPISGLKAQDSSAALGHVSPSFQLQLTDSRPSLLLLRALDCRKEQAGETCRVNPRDVVVFHGPRVTRLVAPQIASWMASGWEADVTRGSQEELAAFMERRFPTVRIPSASPLRMWMFAHPSEARVALPLVGSNPGDAAVMGRVLEWLRNADAGSSDTELGDAQRFDATEGLIIAFPGDFGLAVAPAYICISDGTNEPCYRSPDEVLVDDFRGLRGPYHLRSPELAGWLASGYLQDMRMGTYAEYEREAHW